MKDIFEFTVYIIDRFYQIQNDYIDETETITDFKSMLGRRLDKTSENEKSLRNLLSSFLDETQYICWNDSIDNIKKEIKNFLISSLEVENLYQEVKSEIHDRTLKSVEWFKNHFEWRKIHLPVSTPEIKVQTENMYKPLELE